MDYSPLLQDLHWTPIYSCFNRKPVVVECIPSRHHPLVAKSFPTNGFYAAGVSEGFDPHIAPDYVWAFGVTLLSLHQYLKLNLSTKKLWIPLGQVFLTVSTCCFRPETGWWPKTWPGDQLRFDRVKRPPAGLEKAGGAEQGRRVGHNSQGRRVP